MEITTVGAGLVFAGELEQKIQSSYTRMLEQVRDDEVKKVFSDLAAANSKRQIVLKRVYDDNVYSDMDTGVLAPIASMDRVAYSPSISDTEPATDQEIVAEARVYEKKLKLFYNDLTTRLQSGPRPITRRIDKLAKEIDERLGMLEALLD
jgi:hypothetical protein